MQTDRLTRFPSVVLIVIAFFSLTLSLMARQVSSTQPIPPTPIVGWTPPDGDYYHLTTCDQSKERTFARIPYWEAVQRKLISCERCKPHTDPKIAQANANSLHVEMRARDLAEAKRRVDDANRKQAEAARALEAALSQPLLPLPESRIRQLAQAAEPAANNDPDKFRQTFRISVNAALKSEKGSAYAGPFAAHASDQLFILVTGPVARFEAAFAERVRKFENTTGVQWSSAVTVSVLPRRIGAPSISKLVLQRGGTIVAPLSSTLKPAVLQTAMNAKEMIYQGDVSFPATAFEPAQNLDLKLTAIPEVGSNIIHKFTNAELRTIR